MLIRFRSLVAAGVLSVLVWVVPARAELFENVLENLSIAGFQILGVPTPFDDGYSLQLTRTFVGETLDFGATDLALIGPIGMTFNKGTRGIPSYDLSFTTFGQSFQYIYGADTGGQEALINGNFALDSTMSINAFGFYDMRFDFSSRQDFSSEGRFSNEEDLEQDFDLGPIDVSGNIFADILAALFEPIFDATGRQNFFASFSSRGGEEQSLFAASQSFRAGADAHIGGFGIIDSTFMGLDFGSVGQLASPAGDPAAQQGAIPEPGTMVLLVGGLAGWLARRSRPRRCH